jgi:hypothetical protein
MLGSHLASLDIPSDGSAKLVSVKTAIDEEGNTTWTVVFRSSKSCTLPVAPVAKPEPPAAPETRPKPLNTVTFAPQSMAKPPPSAQIIPKSLVPAASPIAKVMMDRIFPLKAQVKTYAWGKLGDASLVGVLASEGIEELDLTAGIPYAELWMGTHPSGAHTPRPPAHPPPHASPHGQIDACALRTHGPWAWRTPLALLTELVVTRWCGCGCACLGSVWAGPSMVMLSSPWRTVTPLSEWIKLNPSLLGPARPHDHTKSPKLERRVLIGPNPASAAAGAAAYMSLRWKCMVLLVLLPTCRCDGTAMVLLVLLPTCRCYGS